MSKATKSLMTGAAFMAAMAFSPVLAEASVTLNMFFGNLYRADGVTPLPTGSIITLVADAGNDGFGDLTQATSSFGGDSNDVVLATFASNDFGGPGTVFDALQLDQPSLVGRKIQLAWYDTLLTPGTQQGPGHDVDFGTFRTDIPNLDGTNGTWVYPSDGFTISLNFLTATQGGSNPESAGRAQLRTAAGPIIPEPSSALLLAIGGGLLLTGRRNRVNA